MKKILGVEISWEYRVEFFWFALFLALDGGDVILESRLNGNTGFWTFVALIFWSFLAFWVCNCLSSAFVKLNYVLKRITELEKEQIKIEKDFRHTIALLQKDIAYQAQKHDQ